MDTLSLEHRFYPSKGTRYIHTKIQIIAYPIRFKNYSICYVTFMCSLRRVVLIRSKQTHERLINLLLISLKLCIPMTDPIAGSWAGLMTVWLMKLENTQPRGQINVHAFGKHRKSTRRENIWKLNIGSIQGCVKSSKSTRIVIQYFYATINLSIYRVFFF